MKINKTKDVFGIYSHLRSWVHCSCRAHTHAYALWAADVLLAVFAPAFPLSLCDKVNAGAKPAKCTSAANEHRRVCVPCMSSAPTTVGQ